MERSGHKRDKETINEEDRLEIWLSRRVKSHSENHCWVSTTVSKSIHLSIFIPSLFLSHLLNLLLQLVSARSLTPAQRRTLSSMQTEMEAHANKTAAKRPSFLSLAFLPSSLRLTFPKSCQLRCAYHQSANGRCTLPTSQGSRKRPTSFMCKNQARLKGAGFLWTLKSATPDSIWTLHLKNKQLVFFGVFF